MIKKGNVFKSRAKGSKILFEVQRVKDGIVDVKMIGGKDKVVMLKLQVEHFLKMIGLDNADS